MSEQSSGCIVVTVPLAMIGFELPLHLLVVDSEIPEQRDIRRHYLTDSVRVGIEMYIPSRGLS